MLAESLILPECVYRPGSFSGLMTIYESNYFKWMQLVGGSELTATQYQSCTTADCDLFLRVLRREAYTSTCHLTYLFEESGPLSIADPDLTLRIYHDARLVEAVCASDRHRHHVLVALATAHADELGRRWRVNLMLNKWLDYLLEMEHCLVAA